VLQTVASATSVSLKNGSLQVQDGPVAEAELVDEALSAYDRAISLITQADERGYLERRRSHLMRSDTGK